MYTPPVRRARSLVPLVLVTGLTAGLSTIAPRARAADTALAEALFQEGKKLLGRKEYAKACPKLAESYHLDPGGGTLLTLALCHEGEGRVATAWSEFTDAESTARRDGRADRARIAAQHVKQLEPKLQKVVLVVAEADANVAGFELERDGVAIGKAAWTIPIPIDSGAHTFTAEAPGKKPWSKTLTIKPDEKETRVEVPALEDDPAAKAAAQAAPSAPASASAKAAPAAAIESGHPAPPAKRSYVAPIALFATGAAALGVGAFFGVTALSAKKDADSRCPATQCNDPEGVRLSNKAVDSANVANVAFGVGIVAVGVGAVLLIAGGRDDSKVVVAPQVAAQGGGVTLRSRW